MRGSGRRLPRRVPNLPKRSRSKPDELVAFCLFRAVLAGIRGTTEPKVRGSNPLGREARILFLAGFPGLANADAWQHGGNGAIASRSPLERTRRAGHLPAWFESGLSPTLDGPPLAAFTSRPTGPSSTATSEPHPTCGKSCDGPSDEQGRTGFRSAVVRHLVPEARRAACLKVSATDRRQSCGGQLRPALRFVEVGRRAGRGRGSGL
jgi:hypothetical protein